METMVVVVIFALVMSLALTVFLANVRSHRVALNHQRLVNETSYALERVAQETKEGEGASIEEFLSDVIKVESERAEEKNGRTTIHVETSVLVEGEEGNEDETRLNTRMQTTVLER